MSSTSPALCTLEKAQNFMKEVDEMADSVSDNASHCKTQDEIKQLRAKTDSDFARHQIKLNKAYLATVYARINAELSQKEKRLTESQAHPTLTPTPLPKARLHLLLNLRPLYHPTAQSCPINSGIH